MRIRPSLRSESGLTLIEIMIAAAMMVVLGLMISTMLYNSTKQQVRIEDRANRSDFLQSTALNLRLKPIPTTTP